MEKSAAELRKEVDFLLACAEKADEEESRVYGKGKRGGELPKELRLFQRKSQKNEPFNKL